MTHENSAAPDMDARFAELKERALVALTFIEHQQNRDQLQAKDGLKMVLGAYKKEEINDGAMLVLTVLLSYEAAALGVPLAERIAKVREIIASGFKLDS